MAKLLLLLRDGLLQPLELGFEVLQFKLVLGLALLQKPSTEVNLFLELFLGQF